MNSNWAVTDLMHTDCAECLKCVESAITHAMVTGSVGATYTVDTVAKAPEWLTHPDHSATVARAVMVVTR